MVGLRPSRRAAAVTFLRHNKTSCALRPARPRGAAPDQDPGPSRRSHGPSSEREAELEALIGVEEEDGHGGAAQDGVAGAGGGGALALELGREARLRGEQREAHQRRREVRRLHDGLVLRGPAR